MRGYRFALAVAAPLAVAALTACQGRDAPFSSLDPAVTRGALAASAAASAASR